MKATLISLFAIATLAGCAGYSHGRHAPEYHNTMWLYENGYNGYWWDGGNYPHRIHVDRDRPRHHRDKWDHGPRPGHTGDKPPHLNGRPDNDRGRPDHAGPRPGNGRDNPPHAGSRPQNTGSRPTNVGSRPQNNESGPAHMGGGIKERSFREGRRR